MKKYIFAVCTIVLLLEPVSDVKAAMTASGFQKCLDMARDDISVKTRSISGTIILSDGTTWNAVSNKAGRSNPVTSNMHFSIASMTKTFVSACIFKLMEETAQSVDPLELTDTVGDLIYNDLPGEDNENYKNIQENINPSVTLGQLLNHTSGLDEYLGNDYYLDVGIDTNAFWSPLDTLEYVNSYDNPGYYNYTNTNYILLGMIIEKVTGQDIIASMHEYVFNPMDVNDIYFRGLEDVPAPNAIGYEKNALGLFYLTSTLIGASGLSTYTSTFTAGNLVTTAEECAKWAKKYYMYLDNNSMADLSSGNLNNHGTNNGFQIQYAYGIQKITEGTLTGNDELWGHTGTIPGFNGFLYYCPGRDISIAILINEHYANRFKVLEYVVDYMNNPDKYN